MSFLQFEAIRPFHAAHLAALGRALAVCQHFEDCARHVATVYAVTDAIPAGAPLSELRDIGKRMGSSSLGRCIAYLGKTDFADDRWALIDGGRVVRNWLAHQAGYVLERAIQRPDVIKRYVDELRTQVAALCSADAIVSIASYEITERASAPSNYAAAYAGRLESWIMEPLAEWVGTG